MNKTEIIKKSFDLLPIYDDRMTISGEFVTDGNVNQLKLHIEGNIDSISFPDQSLSPGFKDNLWEETCFELFTKTHYSKSYYEFNFSPSGNWACYSFDSYREGQKKVDVPPPQIDLQIKQHSIDAVIHFEFPVKSLVGISSIILYKSHNTNFWALTHPKKRPDFHHLKSFAMEIRDRSYLN